MSVNLSSPAPVNSTRWDQNTILEKGKSFLDLTVAKLELQDGLWDLIKDRVSDIETRKHKIKEATEKCLEEIADLHATSAQLLQDLLEKKTEELFNKKNSFRPSHYPLNDIEKIYDIEKVSRAALQYSRTLLKFYDKPSESELEIAKKALRTAAKEVNEPPMF